MSWVAGWLQARAEARERFATLDRVGVETGVVDQLRYRSSVHAAAAIELAKLGIPGHRLVDFAEAAADRSAIHGLPVEDAAYDLGYLSATFGSDYDPRLLNNVAEHFRRR